MATADFKMNGIVYKVPLLTNNLIPTEHLPVSGNERNWYDIRGTTPYNTWVLNDSGVDQIISSRHGTSNSTKRSIVRLRKAGTTEQFDFDTNYVSSTGITRYNINTTTIPTGWQWAILFNEGGKITDFDYIYMLK